MIMNHCFFDGMLMLMISLPRGFHMMMASLMMFVPGFIIFAGFISRNQPHMAYRAISGSVIRSFSLALHRTDVFNHGASPSRIIGLRLLVAPSKYPSNGPSGGVPGFDWGPLFHASSRNAISIWRNRFCLNSPNLAIRSLKGNEGNWRTALQDTKAPLKTLFLVLNPLIPLCN